MALPETYGNSNLNIEIIPFALSNGDKIYLNALEKAATFGKALSR